LIDGDENEPMPDPKPAKADRTWLYVGLGFVVFWGIILLRFNPLAMLPEAPGFESPEPADYTWQLFDLDDKPVEFSRFKGKAVFLNIWATWCGPCIKEMPSIASLAADPKLKDVAFVCVSTDESAGTVKQFLADKSWPMTILRADDVPKAFFTPGIPATFLIAPDGSVADMKVGATFWNTPKMVAFLESLAIQAK
jgi:thiol-disulfide isomerase/thioredoxin